MMRSSRLAALAAVTLLLAACGSAAGQVTTNGAPDKPVTLTGVSYNVTGRSGGDQLVKFTELVTKLSNGSITISAGPEPDSGKPDTSAETIAAVRENRADLGIVSARTFDTLGVTSFQALQAPYVVTSQALADKVLADPIAEKMLDGAKQLGLVGIGLAADFMAYPAGYGASLLSPDDYRGKGLQVRPSRANDLLVQALGAKSDPRNGQDLAKAVTAKEVSGGWGYFDGPSQPVGGMVFTANEPVFARANVIVVNEKVFAGLSSAQQQALRDAAAQTRDWTVTQNVNPVIAAAAYCSSGYGSIALASPDQLAATKTATASVVTALEQETVTREVIARTRELAAALPAPSAPAACNAATTSSVPLGEFQAKGDQKVIDGVWRLVVEEKILLDGGASPNDAVNNAGTWTWTFADGTLTYENQGQNPCTGSLLINGSDLRSTSEVSPCDVAFFFTFTRSGDTMRMAPTPDKASGLLVTNSIGQTVVPDGDAFWKAFFHNELVRVGDAP